MSTKRKVYTFYIIAILVMVLVLMLFDLNIMAKAIVGLMIVFCIFVMRSIQTAYQLPNDIDPDTMLQIEPHGKSTAAMSTEKLDHNSNVDLYLRLLIEADEELAKDPTIDQMSLSMPLPWTTMILWLFISVISAVGNAGVPMGCYFLTLSLMSGINAPIGIMGIILPIYTIIDMIETAENVWSDSCVCAMVDRDLKR